MKRKSEQGNKPAFVKRKTELVFNPEKRAEFLTGFHKRKLHRKKVAQGELQRKLKEDTRRFRAEAKENMKKLYHSYKPIPELSAQEQEEEEQEYDTENVTVRVVELSTKDLAKQNNWIGENHAMVRGEVDDSEPSETESIAEENDLRTIPGMDLASEGSTKNKKSVKHDVETPEKEETEEKSTDRRKQQPRGPVLNLEGIRSKKELNHKLKLHAQKSLKKSKAYQQTVRAQQQKQMKKSRRVRHVREKILKRKGKLPKDGGGNDRGGNRKKRGAKGFSR